MRRLSEYGSVAYLVERPTQETQAEQYSDQALALQDAQALVEQELGRVLAISELSFPKACGSIAPQSPLGSSQINVDHPPMSSE